MIDSLLTGLTLAAVSGISFLAYRHPGGYRKLSSLILFLVALVVLTLFGFYFGRITVHIDTLNRMMSIDSLAPLASQRRPIQDMGEFYHRIGMVFQVALPVALYVGLLTYLPKIMTHDKPPAEGSPGRARARRWRR